MNSTANSKTPFGEHSTSRSQFKITRHNTQHSTTSSRTTVQDKTTLGQHSTVSNTAQHHLEQSSIQHRLGKVQHAAQDVEMQHNLLQLIIMQAIAAKHNIKHKELNATL